MKKIIVLLFILTSGISFSQGSTDCPDIKTGFYGYGGQNKSLLIYRSKSSQLEYDMSTDTWIVLKLDWISDCEYHFTYYKTTMLDVKPFIGERCSASVVSHDAEGYLCKVISLDNDYPPSTGTILYKNNLSKKIQKKLKKILKKNS